MAIDNSKVVKAVIQKVMETETVSHVLVRFYCEEESGEVEKTIQEAVFEWTPGMTEGKMIEMIMQNIEHLQKQIVEYSAEDSRAAARNFVEKYKDKPIVVSAASSPGC